MKATDVLKQEHRVIEQVLDCLERIAERAADTGELDRESAGEALKFFRGFADACHHGKEEDRLFPAMNEKGIPADVGPVGVMISEHVTGRTAVFNMAAALEGNEPQTFATYARGYVSHLREHIAKEDNILFPMADSVLGDTEQEQLFASFTAFEDEEMGVGRHEEFVGIANDLAKRYDVAPACERVSPGCEGCCHQTG